MKYLDITKSIMISSPAGSGKTEKLARRYIALLQNGSEVERILAITFTEKAAAEMKERILSILKAEDQELFEKVRERMPRMRISTIHSFCRKLLSRFCIDLGVDPSFEVMDSFSADILWAEAVYESLRQDGESGERAFSPILKETGIKGWAKLFRTLNEFHAQRPAIERAIKDRTIDLESLQQPLPQDLVKLYSTCLECYTRKKKARHAVDFNDLELMAYEAISRNPEWQNILCAFDEHTDHLLVDEFQDTSSLQWNIINKLTEEWRSGIGAKRASGVKPTMFFVGDEKQSIYSFRGANVEIFKKAKDQLAVWMGEEHHFIEVKENYRSLPEIVNFVNMLFEKIMPAGLYEDLKIEYSPFEATREGKGHVELLEINYNGRTRENRKIEAACVASKIVELCGTYEIHQGGKKRPCSYGDMAILLRNRTHIALFEDALRQRDVPFIIVKGVGFYNTTEVALLRDLLFFLIDPYDDYSLFTVLRSPLCSLDYETILRLMDSSQERHAGMLYSALEAQQDRGEMKQQHLWQQESEMKLKALAQQLSSWRERAKNTPYSILIEDILTETAAWRYFSEKQCRLNVKKFLKLIEEFQGRGLSGVEIREKLIRASAKSDEAKANIATEGMDAVKIMTVHASKGLQFPIVFVPCLDEGSSSRLGSIVMEERDGRLVLSYGENYEEKKGNSLFQLQKQKIEEEEKRLFYVAATRAMEYLSLSGVTGKMPTGRLSSILGAFTITAESKSNLMGNLPFTYKEISGNEFQRAAATNRVRKGHAPGRTRRANPDEPLFLEPLQGICKPEREWIDLTKEIGEVQRRHGEQWRVLGRILHRMFAGFAGGQVTKENQQECLGKVLRGELLSKESAEALRNSAQDILKRLQDSPFFQEVFLPHPHSHTELPFLYEQGRKVYKGKVDRVIIKESIVHFYDYRVYPVTGDEIPRLVEMYAPQLDVATHALETLFSMKAKGHILFTYLPRLVSLT